MTGSAGARGGHEGVAGPGHRCLSGARRGDDRSVSERGPMPRCPRGFRAFGAAVLMAAVSFSLAACGVEVPDDIASRATSTTTTTTAVPQTTAVPTSDDELEQALIDNGFSLAEARCGAEALRESLSEGEIEEITGLESIGDIDASLAEDYREAVSPCVENGADDDDDGGGGGGGGN